MSEHDELCRRLRAGYPATAKRQNQHEAADAIEALVAERDGLREALEPFKCNCEAECDGEHDGPRCPYLAARRALTASAPPAPHSREAAETQPRPPTPEPAKD